ncbi:MAG: ComF family protein [Mogibacterium sp.]|nr:ComF family protein [Mogibacterium sp.]
MSRESWLRRIGNEMLDLVYPPGLYCICCGKITDDSRTYRLCNDCMRSMNWNTGRSCSKCGRPLADTDPGEMCFGCSQREAAGQEHSFDRGHVCAAYGACAQAVIFALKYGGRSDIGDTLGEILFDRMLSEYEAEELAAMYDIVTPVPLHADKLKKRGFNHAELMGRNLAKRAGLRFDPGMLIRTRGTLPMKGLGPEERRANIRGAFSIRNSRCPQIEGSRILLIDDIFTTGSTIDEIASLLKDQGASVVDFLAFAAAGDMII